MHAPRRRLDVSAYSQLCPFAHPCPGGLGSPCRPFLARLGRRLLDLLDDETMILICPGFTGLEADDECSSLFPTSPTELVRCDRLIGVSPGEIARLVLPA
ncbi:MAG TPA: hypothetical protein VHJ18_10030 [Streptosporangiaceae bacterium]|nr:hypothetical protein [Streptosporangiaceae bacterium]